MAVTVQVARTQNIVKPNFGSARLLTLHIVIILLRFVTFHPELKEYILDNKNVCYVYYNIIKIFKINVSSANYCDVTTNGRFLTDSIS